MKQLLLLAVLASCGGSKSTNSKPATQTPQRTTAPSLAEEAQAKPLPVHSTVDPPLGGWSTPATAPPPPAPPPPVANTPTIPLATKTPPPTTVANTLPPPTTTAPPTTAPPAAAAPIVKHTKPPATPNSCAKSYDCSATYTAAAGAPAATGRGSVKGVLTTGSSFPACPVDLVDGATRRVSSGTAHNGAYEISAAPGHYSVSFERCLGCNPGLVDVELVDAATATVSLACSALAH